MMSQRKFKDFLINIACIMFFVLSILLLLFPLISVVVKGGQALLYFISVDYVAEGATLKDLKVSLFGSLFMSLLSILISIPFSVLLAIFLTQKEFKVIQRLVSFSIEGLSSIPSLLVGIFVYFFYVIPQGAFSAKAGIIAMSLIVVPYATKLFLDILRKTPYSLWEASLALGAPKWKILKWIVFPAVQKSFFMVLLLSVVRVFGETAALLFTSFSNRNFTFNMDEPMASISVFIYSLATNNPLESERHKVWLASLIILATVSLVYFIIHSGRYFSAQYSSTKNNTGAGGYSA